MKRAILLAIALIATTPLPVAAQTIDPSDPYFGGATNVGGLSSAECEELLAAQSDQEVAKNTDPEQVRYCLAVSPNAGTPIPSGDGSGVDGESPVYGDPSTVLAAPNPPPPAAEGDSGGSRMRGQAALPETGGVALPLALCAALTASGAILLAGASLRRS